MKNEGRKIMKRGGGKGGVIDKFHEMAWSPFEVFSPGRGAGRGFQPFNYLFYVVELD
jgi:hypothetical protein